ncbi:hypothetical protein Cni_G05172 [Canna indica]|uniref:Uncharacterized protein n=1 Tax=Canna indica TaxID=4628 RepID=A0AAQ3Q2Z7_9LILI|nr:hypothetical protein Cni_G05172 [Canna indica]
MWLGWGQGLAVYVSSPTRTASRHREEQQCATLPFHLSSEFCHLSCLTALHCNALPFRVPTSVIGRGFGEDVVRSLARADSRSGSLFEAGDLRPWPDGGVGGDSVGGARDRTADAEEEQSMLGADDHHDRAQLIDFFVWPCGAWSMRRSDLLIYGARHFELGLREAASFCFAR